MMFNKDVINSPLFLKKHKPAIRKEKLYTHRVATLFEDPSNNNQRVELHHLVRDIYYLSILFYFPGIMALMYVVFVS